MCNAIVHTKHQNFWNLYVKVWPFFSSAIVFSMPVVITKENSRNVLLASIIYWSFLYIWIIIYKCSSFLLVRKHVLLLLDKNTGLTPHYYKQTVLKSFLWAESSQKENSNRMNQHHHQLKQYKCTRELPNNKQQKVKRVTASRWSRRKAVAKKKSRRERQKLEGRKIHK